MAWYDVPDVSDAIGYLEYSALLNQTGTDDPVATVMKNTIGNIVWTRNATGTYSGTLANAFPIGKTRLIPLSTDLVTNLTTQFIVRNDESTVEIVTADVSTFPAVVLADSILVDSYVNIRVYQV